MSPADFYANPSAQLRWLEMPEGQMFLDYIRQLLESSRTRLEKESEMTEIYRRQGRIDILKDIFNLPDELRQAIKRKVA